MKKLLLVRHAKAAPGASDLSDHERALTRHGKRTARQIGVFLIEHDLIPDKIVSSSAARAMQTAAGLLEGLNIETELIRSQQLYLANPNVITELLRSLPEDIKLPLLIGHNPGISNFIEFSCRTNAFMAPATVAEVHFDISHWNKLEEHTSGVLNNFWNPGSKFNNQ